MTGLAVIYLVVLVVVVAALVFGYLSQSRLLTAAWEREKRWKEICDELATNLDKTTGILVQTTKNLEWALGQLPASGVTSRGERA